MSTHHLPHLPQDHVGGMRSARRPGARDGPRRPVVPRAPRLGALEGVAQSAPRPTLTAHELHGARRRSFLRGRRGPCGRPRSRSLWVSLALGVPPQPGTRFPARVRTGQCRRAAVVVSVLAPHQGRTEPPLTCAGVGARPRPVQCSSRLSCGVLQRSASAGGGADPPGIKPICHMCCGLASATMPRPTTRSKTLDDTFGPRARAGWPHPSHTVQGRPRPSTA